MNVADEATGFRPPYTTQFPWKDRAEVIQVRINSQATHLDPNSDGYITEALFVAMLTNGEEAGGLGATIADAERAAWAKLNVVTGCPGHDFNPRGKSDGQGWCRHCGQFKHDALTAADLGLFCHECGEPSFEQDWRGPVCAGHHPGKKYLDRYHALAADRRGAEVSLEELEMIMYYNAAAQGQRIGNME